MSETLIRSSRTKRVKSWAIFLLFCGITLVFALIGSMFVNMEYQNKSDTRLHYRERMDPLQTEPGLTPADTTLPRNAHPIQVNTGIYIDRIQDISMRDLSWTVDCYIWFNCDDTTVNVGENFQVVDGWIQSKERKDEYIRGNSHYALYRMVAQITSVFDETRFPCDDHLLTICIEDPSFTRDKMIFVADEINSSVSSRVKVPGYNIYQNHTVEKPHSYKTSRGDPRLSSGSKATYSQLRMGVWIKRDGWGFFLKMFLPLYVAVSVSILAFFVKPTDVDPRFGLGVGALFAAVANSYITSSMLPNTGIMSLADIINIMGIVTILVTLIESTISLHIYDIRGKKILSHRLDILAFWIVLPGYALLNIAVVIAAAS